MYCYNDGVSVKGSSWIAGVVACLHAGVIKHCYNTGSVTGDGTAGGDSGTANGTVGGETAHSIKKVANTGLGRTTGTWPDGEDSARTFNVYNSGTISSTGSVGGVIAWHQNGIVNQTFNTGGVTSTLSSQETGNFGYIAGQINTSDGAEIGQNYILEDKERTLAYGGSGFDTGTSVGDGISESADDYVDYIPSGSAESDALAKILNDDAEGDPSWAYGSGVTIWKAGDGNRVEINPAAYEDL